MCLLFLSRNRFDHISLVRNLCDNNWANDFPTEEEKIDEEEQMDTDVKLSKPGRHYKDQVICVFHAVRLIFCLLFFISELI